MAKQSKGGGARKIGNNKEACKLYAMRGRLLDNKKRTKRRLERQAMRKEFKMLARIRKNKPVPPGWLTFFRDAGMVNL